MMRLLSPNATRSWAARLLLLGFALVLGHRVADAQFLLPPFDLDFSLNNLGSVSPTGGALAFAPGVDDKVYVGTLAHGLLVFDYDPDTGVSNGMRAVGQADTTVNGGGADGALGIAFHQDPTHGLVMYYAPNTFGADPSAELQLRRANDSGGNGVFGDQPGELNQAIVDNLRARGEGGHQLNNLEIRGDTLYLAIGSRTQNGGVDVDGRLNDDGNPAGQTRDGLQAGNAAANPGSAFGEYAYTGALTFIEDVTQIGAGANAAGFNLSPTESAHATATEYFTSLDPGKLRVYATGFRNVYGLGVNDQGRVFASENQNEFPNRNPADRILEVGFRDDFGYQKSNGFIDSARADPDLSLPAVVGAGEDGSNGAGVYDILGTYRDPSGSTAALIANSVGYFQQTATLDSDLDGDIDEQEMRDAAFALVEPSNGGTRNPAVVGLDFVPANAQRQDLVGDIVVGRFAQDGLSIIDRDTGEVNEFVVGFSNPIDVRRDPFGNLLALSTTGALLQVRVPQLPLLPGDHNADGFVDAADYTVLRDNLGFATVLPNETASPGVVDGDDLAVWRNNYGAAVPGAHTIPESFPAWSIVFVAAANRRRSLTTRS